MDKLDKRIVYTAYPCLIVSGVAVIFLAKWGSGKVAPFLLNGLRLAIASIVLLVLAFVWRINLSIGRDIWRYATVGLLLMAIPQALLFSALSGTATPNLVAFAEATVPGIVIIYLLAGGWKLEWKGVACVLCALAGLTLFFFTAGLAKTERTSVDIKLVLISSAVSALGLVVSRILPKPSVPGLANKLNVWSAV